MKTPALSEALAALAVLLTLAPASRAEPSDTITIRVIDNSTLHDGATDLPTLYLPSSANGWNPGAWPSTHATLDTESGRCTWTFTLDRTPLEHPGFAFKLTRGNWETVEVNAEGHDISDRTLEGIDLDQPITLTIEGFADQRGTRWPKPRESSVSAGHLDVFTLASTNLDTRRAIRVWLPDDYFQPENADKRFPVMYMHDGQNLFDAATSFSGEWTLDETASLLAARRVIEPIIVVGIDNGGSRRAAEYNPPYTAFDDKPNIADRYVDFLVDELMPLVNERYRTRTGPLNTGIGGSSYGGNVSLFALMHRPEVFGRALIESPAVIAHDGAILDAMEDFGGRWPVRLFVAVGTRETGDPNRDKAYVAAVERIHEILTNQGLDNQALRLVIEEDARHNEEAWARRLPDALAFLWSDPGPRQ